MTQTTNDFATPFYNILFTMLLTIFYFISNYIVQITRPNSKIVRPSTDKTKKNSNFAEWDNTMISLLHSITSSILLFVGIIYDSQSFGYLQIAFGYGDQSTESIQFHSQQLLYGITFSINFCIINSLAFFIHDLIMFIINGWCSSSRLFLTIHHALIIICYGISLLRNNYTPILLLTLLAEINSNFMHLRKICILIDKKRSKFYDLISFFLVTSYVPSRTIPHLIISFVAWQIRSSYMFFIDFCLSFGSMLVLNLLNAYFLSKFLNTDVFRQSIALFFPSKPKKN